ncbi:putative metallophosphoesterase [Mesomycoplasma conjunctivae]|uniref:HYPOTHETICAL Uncharacterized protein MG246 homolog n=1 Tax=Mesomycoplasma conjunctivae (strain ATCC 25834 / NCTC 10147 / HRC/581) TaxID=572263 RepID=C5J6H1_MESCH|nr:TIGR00282 family metallophosphoesterase [Mesomycoplasma conjunctivae]CAT05063.1 HYPOTHETICAL Uncharacterized protein MG246 homolog [Mesomycoplasma conjunctivae]VEU66280.1 putative metallophosphoesterase [Mesomycoplasma conjunctivae]
MKKAKILFVGDIFGQPGINFFEKELARLKKEHNFDLVIVQAENITGRKGLNKSDYQYLQKVGVDVFTIGNHVWFNPEINLFINNKDIVRPLNIAQHYQGHGTTVIEKNGKTFRVTSLLGITFNKLNKPWQEEEADNFFDAIDKVVYQDESDFHIVDFHAETTSEKNILGIYLNGKVSAVVGTHTHVQTSDARVMSHGTLFITDVGMTGPSNDAIGVKFLDVYKKMRYAKNSKFTTSKNKCQFNAVILELSNPMSQQKITPIYSYEE